eukprot:TRINITY_DN12520_c0_g1_i1.p1 TRINITY_DN12520_c0_g1~~TRINITY_DN12520_c0_g1_i1.p1  ORF type:complete len:1729 (+),score=301.89 TRINITY_DN12520_c0_g1_i1:87-5189(+)
MPSSPFDQAAVSPPHYPPRHPPQGEWGRWGPGGGDDFSAPSSPSPTAAPRYPGPREPPAAEDRYQSPPRGYEGLEEVDVAAVPPVAVGRERRLSPSRGSGPRGPAAIHAVAPLCRPPVPTAAGSAVGSTQPAQTAAKPGERQGAPAPRCAPPHGASRALLVAAGYSGEGPSLHAPGAGAALQAIRQWLSASGFLQGGVEVRELADHTPEPPGRTALLSALRWLVRGAVGGDSLFLLLCGRGRGALPLHTLPDDGLEDAEGFVPIDWREEGLVHSDELWDILIGGLAGGARLTVVADVPGASSRLLPLPHRLTVQPGGAVSRGGEQLRDPAHSEIPAHVTLITASTVPGQASPPLQPGAVSAAFVNAARGAVGAAAGAEALASRLQTQFASVSPQHSGQCAAELTSSRPFALGAAWSLYALPPDVDEADKTPQSAEQLRQRVRTLEAELRGGPQQQQRGALCRRVDRQLDLWQRPCPGAARAVLIGSGRGEGLRDTGAAARAMRALLMEQGFDARVRLLSPDSGAAALQPTRVNMLTALGWLSGGAEPGEAMWLYFSGRSAAACGDEGVSGGCAPQDWETRGVVTAEEAHAAAAAPLPAGSVLTCVCDLAEGGCMLELPYKVWQGAGGELRSAHVGGGGGVSDGGAVTARMQAAPGTRGARVLAICVCPAEGGEAPEHGALSEALSDVLQRAAEPSVADLMALLSEQLKGRARPMLCASWAVAEHDTVHFGVAPRAVLPAPAPAAEVADGAGETPPASPRHWVQPDREPEGESEDGGDSAPAPGARVRRDPRHWRGGEEDGGEGEPGTVVSYDPSRQRVTVRWEVTKKQGVYRWSTAESGPRDVCICPAEGFWAVAPRPGVAPIAGATKALLVMLRYPGEPWELPPSGRRYFRQLRRFAADRGFTDCQCISDDPDIPGAAFAPPMRAGLTRALLWLARGALPGDALYLHYVGHGAGIEGPRRAADSTPGVAPADWRAAGVLGGEDVARCLLSALPRGARLVVVSDIAGGGSVLPLPHRLEIGEGGAARWTCPSGAAPAGAEAVELSVRRAGGALAPVAIAPPGALSVGLMTALAACPEPAVPALLCSLRETAQQLGSGVAPSLSATAPCEVFRFGTAPAAAAGRSDTVDWHPPATRAVVVGLGHAGAGPAMELPGAPRAARAAAALLLHMGFSNEGVRLLCDDGEDDSLPPTRDNLTRAARWLSRGAMPGDALCFYFVGHSAASAAAASGADEGAAPDPGVAPSDFRSAGALSAAELADRLVARLPPGVRLTVIGDLHGGGAPLHLPHILQGGGAALGLDVSNPVSPPVMAHAMSLHVTPATGVSAGALTGALAGVLTTHRRPTCAQLLANLAGLLRRAAPGAVPTLGASLRIAPTAPFHLLALSVELPAVLAQHRGGPGLPPATRLGPEAAPPKQRTLPAAPRSTLSPRRQRHPVPAAAPQQSGAEVSPPRRGAPAAAAPLSPRRRGTAPAQGAPRSRSAGCGAATTPRRREQVPARPPAPATAARRRRSWDSPLGPPTPRSAAREAPGGSPSSSRSRWRLGGTPLELPEVPEDDRDAFRVPPAAVTPPGAPAPPPFGSATPSGSRHAGSSGSSLPSQTRRLQLAVPGGALGMLLQPQQTAGRGRGMVVAQLTPGGAAAEGGVLAGDVVLAIQGHPTDTAEAVAAACAAAAMRGDTAVEVSVLAATQLSPRGLMRRSAWA